MTDLIPRADAIALVENEMPGHYLSKQTQIVAKLRALPAAQVADPAQIRADALRDVFDQIRALNLSGRDENGHRWANSDLIDQCVVSGLGLLRDTHPAAPSITVAHDYQPSLNAMDQGDCAICGNGPHTRVFATPPAVSDDVAALVAVLRMVGDDPYFGELDAETGFAVTAALARLGGV